MLILSNASMFMTWWFVCHHGTAVWMTLDLWLNYKVISFSSGCPTTEIEQYRREHLYGEFSCIRTEYRRWHGAGWRTWIAGCSLHHTWLFWTSGGGFFNIPHSRFIFNFSFSLERFIIKTKKNKIEKSTFLCTVTHNDVFSYRINVGLYRSSY